MRSWKHLVEAGVSVEEAPWKTLIMDGLGGLLTPGKPRGTVAGSPAVDASRNKRK